MLLVVFALAACSPTANEDAVSPTIDLTVPSADVVAGEATTEALADPQEGVGGGAEETESETAGSEAESTDLAAFIAELESAVTEKDYAQMQALASEPIAVGAWRSEWRMYEPATMAQEFQNGSLPAPTAVTFTGLTDDEMAALLGQPPATMFSPDTNMVAALHSSGWGESGTDEAILFVVEEENQYSWYAFLYTVGPFAGLEPQGEVIDTDVEFIIAVQDVVMYDGPGENFNEIGGIFEGQTAKVTGQYSTNGWWRVICPDDTIGDCWVSNGTDFTAIVE
jgi:hypothetical protein